MPIHMVNICNTRYWVSYKWSDIASRAEYVDEQRTQGQRPDGRSTTTKHDTLHLLLLAEAYKQRTSLNACCQPSVTLPVTFTLSNRTALGHTMHGRV